MKSAFTKSGDEELTQALKKAANALTAARRALMRDDTSHFENAIHRIALMQALLGSLQSEHFASIRAEQLNSLTR